MSLIQQIGNATQRPGHSRGPAAPAPTPAPAAEPAQPAAAAQPAPAAVAAPAAPVAEPDYTPRPSTAAQPSTTDSLKTRYADAIAEPRASKAFVDLAATPAPIAAVTTTVASVTVAEIIAQASQSLVAQSSNRDRLERLVANL